MTTKTFSSLPGLMVAAAALFLLPGVPATLAGDLKIWYQKPAQHAITEALPIGNARLGGLVFGGTGIERITLNESSLWTGDENPSGDYNKMGEYQVLGDLFLGTGSAAEAEVALASPSP